MDENELRLLIFDQLYQHFQGDESRDGPPSMFVGLQGDKIVCLQSGGAHFAVLVVPATAGAPS